MLTWCSLRTSKSGYVLSQWDYSSTRLSVSSESRRYLEEDHLVVRLREGLQLVAPPPQLAEFVLQSAGQLLGVAFRLALPSGDQLHQLGLTLLHQALQLGVDLPALLQLLLRARLEGR